MKNTISVLAIIAVVLAVIALLTGIVSLTLFWESSCEIYAAANAQVIAAGPIFPLGNMIYVVGGLLIAILLSIFTQASKSFAFEIVAIVVFVAVLPFLGGILTPIQSYLIGQMGSAAMTAMSVSTTVFGSAVSIMRTAEALCLVACGMSIAKKVHAKTTVQ